MATVFSTMKSDCTSLPALTPKQFTVVSAARARTATTDSGTPRGTSSPRYRANVTATAAMPPLCVTSRSTQP